MYNIQTLNKIAACGTDIFDKSMYTISDAPENPDAIMVRSAPIGSTIPEKKPYKNAFGLLIPSFSIGTDIAAPSGIF